MENIRVGCDIVSIKRMQRLNKDVINKIFTVDELKDSKIETLAGKFAAKEACKKIINELSWKDIIITNNKDGRPIAEIMNHDNKISEIDLSISHDKDYAISVVVMLLKNKQ